MKIRIIGACGSGKTTLAKELSNHYKIPYFEIDNLIWDRFADNKKYPEEIRDFNLQSILNLNSWIVEGVQIKEWTLKTIEDADIILILCPHVFVRDFRILKRFLLLKTGIRSWNYNQSFRNVRKMIKDWNHKYDYQEVINVIHSYQKNYYVVKNTREVIRRIEEHCG